MFKRRTSKPTNKESSDTKSTGSGTHMGTSLDVDQDTRTASSKDSEHDPPGDKNSNSSPRESKVTLPPVSASSSSRGTRKQRQYDDDDEDEIPMMDSCVHVPDSLAADLRNKQKDEDSGYISPVNSLASAASRPARHQLLRGQRSSPGGPDSSEQTSQHDDAELYFFDESSNSPRSEMSAQEQDPEYHNHLQRAIDDRQDDFNKPRSIKPVMEFNRLGIECDSNNKISRIWGDLIGVLGYSEPEQLLGKNICTLMTDIVAATHMKKHFPLAKQSGDPATRQVLNAKLKHTKEHVRLFTVMGNNETPVVCSVQVMLNKNHTSKVFLKRAEHVDSPLVPSRFMKHINSIPKFRVEPMQDVVCIAICMANSNNFSHVSEPMQIARLYYDISLVCNQLMQLEFHPFAMLHETHGDSFFFIVNAPFMRKRNNYATFATFMAIRVTVALNKVLDRQFRNTEDRLGYRAAITLGDIAGGVIDGQTFRLFGSAVNLSARLRAEAPRDAIIASRTFIDRLLEESPSLERFVEYISRDVQGFGSTPLGLINNSNSTFHALASLQGD